MDTGTVGARTSPISGKQRHAANPANALLNYAYALLEAETTLALHASGLDPALGIWHTDERHRDVTRRRYPDGHATSRGGSVPAAAKTFRNLHT
jgi:hypothetical protein